MGGGIEVDTEDLRTRAIQVENVQFGDAGTLVSALPPPDTLASTQAALAQLRADAEYLAANQAYGQVEGRRLAETLRSVANAYDRVDDAARNSLDGTGPSPAPVAPENNSIPEPTASPSPGTPGAPPAEEALHVDVAQRRLSDGDGGASLQAAAAAWYANGVHLQEAASSMQAPIQNWEGTAADAAYGKLVAYGAWLTKLGQSWQQLAVEAHRIADAHLAAAGEHTPVYQQYETLLANVGVGNQVSTMVEMEDLQHRSEQIRAAYAEAAIPQRISVDSPPTAVGSAPTAENGDPRRKHPDHANAMTGVSGNGGMAGGGGDRVAQNSPPGRPTGAPAKPPAGEHPAGAMQGAGSPTGGGLPSGALPTEGLSSLLGRGTGSADVADGPRVRPAAAEPGRGGGGAGRGSGGGGAGSIPLPPRLGGVSTGTGPLTQASLVVDPMAPPAQGAMPLGGGVGGAPMHGQGSGGAKEKRRNPGLSPDEALYVEDREFTEEVVGARRRRTVQDSKDSK